MLRSLRVRASQGNPYITDLRKAVPNGFRGRPQLGAQPCDDGCLACIAGCPTGALARPPAGPLRLDLGACILCGDCVEVCPPGKITMGSEPRMGSATRAGLVLTEGQSTMEPVAVSASLRSMFGRSLRLRQVSAGGCNACELELNALGNVNFDLQRFGIEWVASPRHADALVLSGPLTKAMSQAVRLAWDAMPEPRFLVSVGACAISGGLYAEGAGVDRAFLEDVAPALYVPGCPPHPLTFVNAILELLGIEGAE
jgi:Ni,Fe-hydrogenase III small subunit/Pyruvate/2-oxoacid:ferredoxin oxidoreductase delta subunit